MNKLATRIDHRSLDRTSKTDRSERGKVRRLTIHEKALDMVLEVFEYAADGMQAPVHLGQGRLTKT